MPSSSLTKKAGFNKKANLKADQKAGHKTNKDFAVAGREKQVRAISAGLPSMAPLKSARNSGRDYEPDHEIVLSGQAVGPGIAVGVTHIYEPGAVRAPVRRILPEKIIAEHKRLNKAVDLAGRQMNKLQEKSKTLPAAAHEELGYLLEAHHQMLKGSRLIRGVERRIETDLINAEAALEREIADLVEAFSSMDDSYLAGRANDIRDVGYRLIRNLTRTPFKSLSDLPHRAVIIARELTPADTALLDPKKVAGFATVLGGAESHTAIMARSLGLPAAVSVGSLLERVVNGAPVVVDGLEGKVILNPGPKTLDYYRKRRADYLRMRRNLGRLRDLPATTTDGVRLSLMANVELPGELDNVKQAGAEGVGLLRSEFIYMNRLTLPTVEEQAEILCYLVTQLEGRPLTVRTLDVGGDKLSDALGIPASANPALGLRAVRLSLRYRDIFKNQLRAILRAAVCGPVRILLPMVASVDEVLETRKVLAEVVAEMKAQGDTLPDPLPPLGVMIEVPGAALSADALAAHADFFAIGTNDLTQYTLAIDRVDQDVASLYNPLHPAVLRLIQFATQAGLRARIPVSVCGEMAGDPRMVPLLTGLGIRELSMSATALPLVKQRIRKLNAAQAVAHANQVMLESDSQRISTLMQDF